MLKMEFISIIIAVSWGCSAIILVLTFTSTGYDVCDNYGDCNNCNNYISYLDSKDQSWKDEGDGILKSELSGGVSNVSLVINEPCNIIFEWEIGEGDNSLELLDNNDSTGIVLQSDIGPNFIHGERKSQRKYLITDYREHDIKFVHLSYGSWPGIAKIKIQVEPLVCFRNAVVTVPERPYLSTDEFTFIVDVDSKYSYFIVSLFIIPPNRDDADEYRKYFNGQNPIKWENITLNCNDFGESKYWFEAYIPGISEPIKSKIKQGPDINFVIDEGYSSGNTNGYYMNIKGYNSALVSLFRSDDNINWNQCGESKRYNGDGNVQRLFWPVQNHRNYHYFDIDDLGGL